MKNRGILRRKEWKARMPQVYNSLTDEDGKVPRHLSTDQVESIAEAYWLTESEGLVSLAQTPQGNSYNAVKVVQTWERLAKFGYVATAKPNYDAWKRRQAGSR
jgi:hypothetical protein